MSQRDVARRRRYALSFVQMAIIAFGLYGALNSADMVLFAIILGLSLAFFALGISISRAYRKDPPT